MRTDRTGDDLGRDLRRGSGTVGIYGLGLTGMSLAASCVGPAATVKAVGRNDARAQRLLGGELPPGVPDRLAAVVRTAVTADVLQPTDDAPATAAAADVHVVTAPVDARSDRLADLRRVRTAVRDVATGLNPGDLVVVQSPVPPGTTTDVVRPLLVQESDLDPDQFGLAYCVTTREDDRIGRPKAVVGGCSVSGTNAAESFYETITHRGVHTVESPTVAEMAATACDLHEYVTTALSGELARLAEELDTDVASALEAAETVDGPSLPDPVPGPRGHRLPFAPYRLLGQTGTPMPLVDAARETMIDLPEFLTRATVRQLHAVGVPTGNATVAVCGLLPVPDGSIRQVSPAVPVTEALDERGASVLGVDPTVDDFDPFAVDPASVEGLKTLDVDAAVILEDRAAFRAADWEAIDPAVVVDTVDVLDDVPTRHYAFGRGVT